MEILDIGDTNSNRPLIYMLGFKILTVGEADLRMTDRAMRKASRMATMHGYIQPAACAGGCLNLGLVIISNSHKILGA